MHKGYIANGVLGIHIPGKRSIAMRMGELKSRLKDTTLRYGFIQDC